MRAKDLRKYKTLDITELSGSPWNDAEKVLGLDQDDKVIMAEPEETVTPEYVDEAIAEATENLPTKNWVVGHCDLAINQAMEVETARTEDTYAKKEELPDMDDYYTKEEVDEAISGITVDLSDYYTKDETDQAISAATQDLASTDYVDDAIANETARTENTYLKQSAIEDDQFPTKNWVKGHTALAIEHSMEAETARTESTYAKKSEIPSLDGYATETYVDDAIAAIPPVDLSEYALISSVTADINTAIANETARTESTYAKPSQIPSLDGYATEQWVESQGYLTEHQDLSAYAKTTAVTEDIQTAMATETGRTEEVYAKKSEIPSLDGYATQAWTTGDTESRIASAMASETARTESTYLKEHQSLDNYYTKSEVDADFVSAATAVGNAIDAAVQGLASETYVDNAVAGLASEDYVDAAVTAATENLASESYVDAAITSATQNLATEQYVDDAIAAIPEPDLSDYYTKSEVDSEITGATEDMATKTWVGQQGYLTQHQDISGKLDKTDFDTYTGATETALAEKLDASAYTVDNAIDSASTNPVENRAVYDALYGTSATTELQVLETDSTWNASIGNTLYPLKNTTIENLKVIYLGDIVPSGNSQTVIWFLDGNDVEYKLKVGQGISGRGSVDSGDVGNTMFWFAPGVSTPYNTLVIYKSILDGTYEYYLLFDTEKLGCVVYKNLPTGITEVSDHSAQISDLPTAQDGSNSKQYVYNGGRNDYKRVISKVELEVTTTGNINNKLVLTALRPNMTGWNNLGGDYGTTIVLPAGSEASTGVKTQRDSTIINRAEEALSGMTEQVTLTIGSTTTGSQYRIYVNSSAKNLYTTNDPRYYVYSLPLVSSDSNGCWKLDRLYIAGTQHRISNPAGRVDSNIIVDGKYQLFPYNSSSLGILYVASATTKYAIVDVELKTLEIADSLTITRAKNIQEALNNIPQPDMDDYVSKDELTGVTATPVVISNTDSSVRASIYTTDWMSGTSVTLKTTNVGNLVGIHLSDYCNTTDQPAGIMAINFLNGNDSYEVSEPITATSETYVVLRPGGIYSTYSIIPSTLDGTYDYTLLYNTDNNSVCIFKNPVVGEDVPGILDDYWTTGETQSAITAATQGMVTSGDVATQIGTAMASETARTESTYAKPSQIPSLNGYATEQWVQNQGYLTQHQSLAEYYTKTEIDGMIGDIESLLASI